MTLLLSAAALAIVACGRDAPPKSDYLAVVNDRCERLLARTVDLADEHFGDLEGPPSERQTQAYAEEAVAMQREVLDQLRARPVPEGDEETLEQLYSAWGDALDAAAEDLESADARTAADDFRQRAEDYGVSECAGL
jgi:hypothetical protein